MARPRTDGFGERFNRTLIDEFFREKLYTTVEALQEDPERRLHHCNYERPHRGLRNMSRRPIETVETGKVIKKERNLKQAA